MAAVKRLAPVAIAFAVSAALLLRLIDRHAVNVLFFDQFDFLQPLKDGASQWQLFDWQHGKHRLGLGYLFIEAVYKLSGWNTRAEAFATAALYFVIVALALLLKRRLVGPLNWTDAFIPALLLSRTQGELFIVTPDAAHGPLPLLLAIAIPLCWEIRQTPLRAAALALLALSCAFTGYAIVFLPCIAGALLLDARRPWALAALAACAVAVALFLHGYVPVNDAACFRFPDAHPRRYLPFMGMVLARPWGFDDFFHGWIWVSSAVAIAAVAFLAWCALHSRPLFLLAACSVSFAASVAVGRVCLGPEQALISRYAAYALPLWLAVFLASRRAAWMLAVAGIAAQWSLTYDHASYYSDGKSRWRDCYLAKQDVRACNVETNFRIYPVDGAPQVEAMFDYLRRNHLNLYGTSNTLPKF